MARVPDAVLAVITQLVLGLSLATSAVPPKVLSMQNRACETVGVLIVIIITAVAAQPLRRSFGDLDLATSEFLLAVLTPVITRVDLALLIWVNVNKSLLWAENMLYTTPEESDCIQLLVLASAVWHDGENHLYDSEFGYHGGDASAMLFRLQRDYNPRNAGSKLLALLGHITLWPVALFLHLLLRLVSMVGFLPFWALSWVAHLTARHSSEKNGLLVRASFSQWQLLTNRRVAHVQKLFMRCEVASVFDSNQHIIRSSKRKVRQLWAMLGNVDAILQHPHFSRILSASYPMRAPLVLQRVHQDPVCLDVMAIRNKEDVFFRNFTDDPIVGFGEPASKLVILYRVLGWPKSTEYSRFCFRRLQEFADENRNAWRETEQRASKDKKMLSEFLSVRQILRRFLVQLIVLAWCDGLGECYFSGSSEVAKDLADSFLKGSLQGIEMAVRLCNIPSKWNDCRQTASMILALKGTLNSCGCSICEEMQNRRRLTSERYESKPKGEQLAAELHSAGCGNAQAIEDIWRSAVLKWTLALFEPPPKQGIV